MRVAGYTVTEKRLAVLHALYRGLVEDGRKVYGMDVSRQLAWLADQEIISRSGWSYMIPYGSPGEAIIAATPDYPVGQNIFA